MYLSKRTISGFRQIGQGEAADELTFQPAVTALIGKNDSGQTAIIDAVRCSLLSRYQIYFKVQPLNRLLGNWTLSKGNGLKNTLRSPPHGGVHGRR